MKKTYILLFLLTGCMSMPAVRPGFNFSDYKKIGVTKFVSYGIYNAESGAAVADEVIRQLIKRNRSVIEIPTAVTEGSGMYRQFAEIHKVDAIVTGTVFKYVPDGEETIYFKDDKGKIMSEIFFKEAEVGVSIKLVDAVSGEIVWSDDYTYSGFEVDDTITTVIDVIMTRLDK